MTDWLLNLVLVAVGGAVGGLARYWVSAAIARRHGETFPWGTMVVNVSGAACIGVIGGLLVGRETPAIEHVSVWAAVVGGVLGSYTTVSSFTLQTLALVRAGQRVPAALNIVGSVVLCLGAAVAGYAVTLALAASR